MALAWIAYLVPSFLAKRDPSDTEDFDVLQGLTEPRQVVARSVVALEGDQSEVSTPLMRRAVRAEIHREASTAARRRRRILLGLGGLTVGAGVLVALDQVAWYAPVVPAVLLLVFLGLCRYSVVKLNARLDERLASLEPGWREDTISFEVPASLRSAAGTEDSRELSIEISAPVEGLNGSLWDPIPVTMPTYVSKPMVPRTVRTIDLSAPEPTQSFRRNPVVAEAPEQEYGSVAEQVDERRRVVGE